MLLVWIDQSYCETAKKQLYHDGPHVRFQSVGATHRPIRPKVIEMRDESACKDAETTLQSMSLYIHRGA